MLMGVFQLLQAKQNEAQARQDFIDAQLDYWLARNNLDRTLNGVANSTSFTNYALKADGKLDHRVRGNFTFFENKKTATGRDAGSRRADRPPPSTRTSSAAPRPNT